jgi:hypothetical protein
MVHRGKLQSVIIAHWNTHGLSSVEMAIVLPVLLLLIFGMIQFGLGWRLSQVITNGAREGARYGVVMATTDHRYSRETQVVSYLTNSGVPANTGMVVSVIQAAVLQPVRAAAGKRLISVPIANLIPVLLPFPSTLCAQAVMRHE